MTQLLLLTLILGTLAACGEYREPRANCFIIVTATEEKDPCEFFELGGPDRTQVIDA